MDKRPTEWRPTASQFKLLAGFAVMLVTATGAVILNAQALQQDAIETSKSYTDLRLDRIESDIRETRADVREIRKHLLRE